MLKVCRKCNIEKPLKDFYKRQDLPDGHQYMCKYCTKIENKQYVQKNMEKIRKGNRAYYTTNKKKVLEQKGKYYLKNKENIRKKQNEYKRSNRGKFNAIAAMEYTKKKDATPKWLTKEMKEEIKEWYILAKELRWLSEEDFHVDHIIPIKGKSVCGLHVPWNLQLLSKSDNLRKSNRMEE